MLWSYFACILTDPGRVPEDFQPSGDLDGELQSANGMPEDKSDPRRPRFCRKCQKWKPERYGNGSVLFLCGSLKLTTAFFGDARAHHCSICGRCVLRMDHHCVWVVNCVGEKNYKFFILFLLYTFFLCLICCFALLPFFMKFFSGRSDADKNPAGLAFSFMAFIFDLAFALSLFGFIVMHTRLISANCTTIEMFEKERIKPWPYDCGMRKNFEEVFGSNAFLWFLPVHSLGSSMCRSEERRRLRI